jgi:hypothetical protein
MEKIESKKAFIEKIESKKIKQEINYKNNKIN